jgi:class 3 adenylate cyclase
VFDNFEAGGSHGHDRLAAILAADVVGYSRLMGADKEGSWRGSRP